MSWMCDSCVHNPAIDEECRDCNPEDPARSSYQPTRYVQGKYQDADILCPFYRHTDMKKLVICEGPAKKSSATLRFYNKGEMRKHLRVYCQKDYDKCPLFQATNKKYETGS